MTKCEGGPTLDCTGIITYSSFDTSRTERVLNVPSNGSSATDELNSAVVETTIDAAKNEVSIT